MRKQVIAAIVAALAVGLLSGQAQTRNSTATIQSQIPKKPKTGELTGVVFIITQSGDLKPARFCNAALLWKWRGEPGPYDPSPPSAGVEYMRYLVAYRRSAVERTRVGGFSPEETCREKLDSYAAAVRAAIYWAAAEKKPEQIQAAQADEEGHFKIGNILAGDYILVVWGRAGMNDVVWQDDHIEIGAGQNKSIKLFDPQESCFGVRTK